MTLIERYDASNKPPKSLGHGPANWRAARYSFVVERTFVSPALVLRVARFTVYKIFGTLLRVILLRDSNVIKGKYLEVDEYVCSRRLTD